MNQVSSIDQGTGADVRSFGYDDLHRLTSDRVKTAGGAVVSSIGYGWDNDNNLTSKNTTGFGAAAANTYGYDWANRLTSWNNGSKVVDYGYDDAGNRRAQRPPTCSTRGRTTWSPPTASSSTPATSTVPWSACGRPGRR